MPCDEEKVIFSRGLVCNGVYDLLSFLQSKKRHKVTQISFITLFRMKQLQIDLNSFDFLRTV